MKITAVTKYKHGELLSALQKAEWNQADLARKAEIRPTTISKIINLQGRPTESQANAIQKAFGEVGIYLDVLEFWPESFKGLGKRAELTETKEVPITALIGDHDTMYAPSLPEARSKELEYVLECCLGSLPKRVQEVLKMRYYEGMTLEDIGRKIQVTRERVRQIEYDGLRRLQHSSRIGYLENASGRKN